MSLQSRKPNQEFSETFPLLFDIIATIGLNMKELEVLCPMELPDSGTGFSSSHGNTEQADGLLRIGTEWERKVSQLEKKSHVSGFPCSPKY
jgi:hypothetical protein